MKIQNLIREIYQITLFWLCLLPIHIFGQDYRITQIIPYLSDDSLKVDVVVENILQDDILKTLLAGIPLELKINGSLLNKTQQTVFQKLFHSRVSYDVWEEHFWIMDFQQKIMDFEDLAAVQQWINTIHGLVLTDQSVLVPQTAYTIHVQLEIFILGKNENQQLKWWIENSDQTEEDLASRERSTGFRLNLNQLVQMFFSREKVEDKFELSKTSPTFTLSDLQFP